MLVVLPLALSAAGALAAAAAVADEAYQAYPWLALERTVRPPVVACVLVEATLVHKREKVAFVA